MIVLKGRKSEICKLLMQGYHPRTEIHKELGMTSRTVKGHLKHIYLAAGIGDRWCKYIRLVYLIWIGEVKLT